MTRKTMRIGEVRTSIKLETVFWDYLTEIAQGREDLGRPRNRLSRLVNEIAMASPERINLASTLRSYCLSYSLQRMQVLKQELQKLTLAGNTDDLARVLDACPLPCLLLSEDRCICRHNEAFATWLNVDGPSLLGQRLDNVMIMRGPSMPELWRRVFGGMAHKARFNATYVSPGKVRTAPAIAIGLPASNGHGAGHCLAMFETIVEPGSVVGLRKPPMAALAAR